MKIGKERATLPGTVDDNTKGFGKPAENPPGKTILN
jgi:hypothetical protein